MIGKKINQLATELAPTTTDLTIIGDPISGVSKKITLEQLGAIFGGAVSFYTTLGDFPATGVIDIIYCAKDTKKLYLWSGSAYVEVFPSQSLLDTYQLRSEKGVSNGYASLDVNGKVPIGQLPNSIMEYKGTWSAATNTPTLANGTGDTGDVYLCNAAGTVNFGAGPITFAVGDYVVYSGSIYQRSSGAVGTVTSVAASITGDSITISGSPISTSGTLAFAFGGNSTQYINGAGNLVTFPGVINEAQNLITEVYNKTGATLTKGTVVYINGGQGNLPTVTKALATGDSTSAQTYGIVRNDITNNNNGYVVVAGRISDLDTQAYTEGTQLYLSPTTAGTYTSTKPYAPNHLVYVGIVVRAHPTQGVIEVKIQNGYEMDELHNVAAQSPDNNDILQYKTATSLWTKVAGTTSNIAEGSNLYYTDARSRAAISLTTTGSSGAASYNNTTGVLNIPNYGSALTGYVPYTGATANVNLGTYDLFSKSVFIEGSGSFQAGLLMKQNNGYNFVTGAYTQIVPNGINDLDIVHNQANTTRRRYSLSVAILQDGDSFQYLLPRLSGTFAMTSQLTGGTVTSVGLSSATSGVTIGSTPITTSGTITLAIATASGSQQGLLSSTDWTTFNNKQSALTNPVTGTGTTNYLPKFTGTSTIGNSNVQDNGSLVSIGVATTVSGIIQSSISASGSTAVSLDLRNTVNALNSNSSMYFSVGSGSLSSTNITGIIRGTVTQASALKSDLVFFTNNGDSVIESMRLNSSGNLGLGVTPSAWSLLTALQISGGASLAGYGGATYLAQNFYYGSGGDTYISNGYSTRYTQFNGQHLFFTAPSGTAGNAISFTQAMTLSANGNLSIGTTNSSYPLQVHKAGSNVFSTVYNVAAFTDGSGAYKGVNLGYDNSSQTGIIYTETASAASNLAIWTYNGSSWGERMRVNSGGDLELKGRSTTANFQALFYNANDQFAINATNTSTGKTINFNPSNTFTALSIASTGAATFSSSVTAGGDILINNSGTTIANIRATSSQGGLDLWSGATADYNGGAGITLVSSDRSGAYTRGELYISAGRATNNTANGFIALSTANTERMRITSGGLVGMGITNPSEKLHLRDTTTGYVGLRLEGSGSYSGSDWTIYSSSISPSTADDFLGFYNNSATDSASAGYKMRIFKSGTVGIGTSTEGFLGKLQVAGSVAITGQYNTVLPSSSFSYFDGSGQVVSSASSASALYLDTTWNTTGNPDGIYLNVTNTASGASSKLMNLKVGSVSQFSVSKAGAIQTTAPSSGSAQPWKLGSYAAGGTGTATGVIYIEINGQIYSIPALQGTP